jgi:hypothetical protein
MTEFFVFVAVRILILLEGDSALPQTQKMRIFVFVAVRILVLLEGDSALPQTQKTPVLAHNKYWRTQYAYSSTCSRQSH